MNANVGAPRLSTAIRRRSYFLALRFCEDHASTLGPTLMKTFFTFILTVALLSASPAAMERPSFHTKGSPTGKPTGALKPGEYWWHPELSPSGPLMVLVSVPEQTMHVYRNGILIGRSS